MLGFGSRNSLGIVCPCPVVSQTLRRALAPLPFDRQGVVDEHRAAVGIRVHDVVVAVPAAPDGADDPAVLGGQHALQARHRLAAPGVRVRPRHQAVQALRAGRDQVDCGEKQQAQGQWLRTRSRATGSGWCCPQTRSLHSPRKSETFQHDAGASEDPSGDTRGELVVEGGQGSVSAQTVSTQPGACRDSPAEGHGHRPAPNTPENHPPAPKLQKEKGGSSVSCYSPRQEAPPSAPGWAGAALLLQEPEEQRQRYSGTAAARGALLLPVTTGGKETQRTFLST